MAERKNIAKKLDDLMENFGNFESEMKEETRVRSTTVNLEQGNPINWFFHVSLKFYIHITFN